MVKSVEKSSGFGKTSLDMPMVLFAKIIKMLNGAMFCMYIKTGFCCKVEKSFKIMNTLFVL
ncbi:hypothetical protein BK708_37370 [Bacillus thuringiensis serovar yunnanensis]|nr:hypothetical protein BK708_37370 [Bacillus thuringiensis serovar yunnanensis]